MTRLMGASLLLLGLATFLIVGFVRSLPQRDLIELAPAETAWVIHANPSALAGQDDLGRAASGALAMSPWLATLKDAGVAISEVREAALVANDEGASAVMVRQIGLGDRGLSLDEKSELALARLDPDTIALGEVSMVQKIAAIAAGTESPAAMSDEDDRLVATLRTAGPIWAWLPNPAGAPGLLGSQLAMEAASVGAAMTNTEPTRIVLRVHGKDVERAVTLESQLDQIRAQASAKGTIDVELERALRAVINEISRDANPDRRTRLRAIEKRLAKSSDATGSSVPAISSLEDAASAWTLHREGTRTTLGADLASPALGPLLNRIGTALP